MSARAPPKARPTQRSPTNAKQSLRGTTRARALRALDTHEMRVRLIELRVVLFCHKRRFALALAGLARALPRAVRPPRPPPRPKELVGHYAALGRDDLAQRHREVVTSSTTRMLPGATSSQVLTMAPRR